MGIDARLTELGIVIPETTAPVANYVTARQSGSLLFLSGHLGKRDGTVVTGRLGDDLDTDIGYDLARNAAIDDVMGHLASLAPMIKESHRISLCVELLVPLAPGAAVIDLRDRVALEVEAVVVGDEYDGICVTGIVGGAVHSDDSTVERRLLRG